MTKRIDKLIKESSVKKTAKAAYLCSQAEEIIKKEIGSNDFKIRKYQNKTLFISVFSPSLAQRIHQKKEEIKEKLDKNLKSPIRRISYKVTSAD